ncbi:protein FAR-RED IMPAIRED RESPONSE 1-like [Cicer arietinum]|uniref:protein FAR-RED IMPAIRED RESPONSE 1-like n=1 Tax=Cicer arietinum TaxID=3827 RepID=UPI003CC5611A
MQHLFKLIEDAKYVCWNRKREDSDVMRDIFWAHPDSVKLLNLFPIVLIMDSTYKTNKYRMPLLEIVGMTSTEKTFVVGFAYLECEREENFCWALERLKDLFVTQNKFPQVIVTDRDLALMNAVGIVFPHAVNLLCRFHIEKNVGAKCKQYVLKDRQESILNMWKDIMYCSNEKEYMMRLHMFEQSCVDTKVFVDYVKETWLTPHKERFVEAWTNKVMHLGNTTTNRVESAHWKLKLMLENSMGDLCKCWEAMNNMIRLQHKRIRASFQKSFYDEEHEHKNPFYQRLNTFVSTEAQRRIDEEYDKVE